VILEHCDDAGRKFSARVAASLSKRGISVKVLSFPGAEGRDVADAIAGGLTYDELVAQVESAPEWIPIESAESPAVETLPQFLERLDKAPPLGWHVPGLIPDEGICLWHAQPRDFKSMCAQEVALALATPRAPFALDRFEVKRAVVVAYFSEEDPERLFAARMRWLTAKTGVPERLHPFIRKSTN
jgi:AAA domain